MSKFKFRSYFFQLRKKKKRTQVIFMNLVRPNISLHALLSPSPDLASSMAPPDELIEEILLRLPPDEPSCLVRASLVCKPWRRIISHRRFRRRLHELHGRPPVLGFLRNSRKAVKDFAATTGSAFSLAVPGDYLALDYRHGRALLLDMVPGWGELVLWDPTTGDQERVPVPEAMWDNTFQGDNPTAAIVCAAAECDHRGCDGLF
nr:uncharacterized protein LOC127307946 [Lolium perenne]